MYIITRLHYSLHKVNSLSCSSWGNYDLCRILSCCYFMFNLMFREAVSHTIPKVRNLIFPNERNHVNITIFPLSASNKKIFTICYECPISNPLLVFQMNTNRRTFSDVHNLLRQVKYLVIMYD